MNRKVDPEMNAVTPTFIINKNDAASFEPEDIILKLPTPVVVGNLPEKAVTFDLSLILLNYIWLSRLL